MKALVTGARGFIGRALLEALLTAGYEVTAVGRRPPERSPPVAWVTRQLGEPLPDDALSGADVLVHLAHDMRLGSFRRNVEGTQCWFEQGERAGTLFQVYVSSYSAHPASPSEYGRTKHALERYVIDRGGTVVRPGLVVGDAGTFGTLVALARYLPILPVGDHDLCVHLTDLRDLVRLISSARAFPSATTLNVFDPQPVALRTLFEEIRSFFGVPGLIVPAPAALARTALALAGTLHPIFRRHRESLLALRASQSYHSPSSYPALGLTARPLENMLRAAFGPGAGTTPDP